MPTQDEKYELTDLVELMLADTVRDGDGMMQGMGLATVEVTRIAPLQVQVKVIHQHRAPRYFNVKVSEML